MRAPTTHLAAGVALGFLGMAAAVLLGGDLPGEREALHGLRSAVGGRLDAAASAVDRLTDTVPLAVVALLLVVALLAAGRRRPALLLAVSFGVAVALNPVWKALVGRPRPAVRADLPDVSALSFPSGHATATAALALGLLLAVAGTRWAAPAAVAGAALVVVTAAAQLVLAVHHPSDLLGGWLWAATATLTVWLLGAAAAGRRADGSGD